MALLDFTSYAEIRAILGVSDDELADATLALELYASSLNAEFDEVDEGIRPKYVAVKEIAAADRTAAEQRFYEVARLFSAYAIAQQLSSSLPLFAPKDIADGKASIGRFADGPYREVIKETRAQYDRLRLRLPAVYNAVTTDTVALPERTYFSVATPDADPVTGS